MLAVVAQLCLTCSFFCQPLSRFPRVFVRERYTCFVLAHASLRFRIGLMLRVSLNASPEFAISDHNLLFYTS